MLRKVTASLILASLTAPAIWLVWQADFINYDVIRFGMGLVMIFVVSGLILFLTLLFLRWVFCSFFPSKPDPWLIPGLPKERWKFLKWVRDSFRSWRDKPRSNCFVPPATPEERVGS